MIRAKEGPGRAFGRKWLRSKPLRRTHHLNRFRRAGPHVLKLAARSPSSAHRGSSSICRPKGSSALLGPELSATHWNLRTVSTSGAPRRGPGRGLLQSTCRPLNRQEHEFHRVLQRGHPGRTATTPLKKTELQLQRRTAFAGGGDWRAHEPKHRSTRDWRPHE